jgi:mannosyltransferase OCH1-like enzyme
MPRRIPKLVHQTWITTSLPAGVVEVVTRMQLHNSDYEFRLYDDRMIDDYIRNEFSSWEYNAFSRLTIGASKADFWRYCILLKQGGIYLDMDAEIVANSMISLAIKIPA